ncbi:MAG: C10 family peptidase [Treponema sp.]|nr:C10 family peptidase [Treponema sp.]
MKKILSLSVILVATFGLFFSCNDISESENNLTEESLRRQELAFYAATGEFISTQDEMEDALKSFCFSDSKRNALNDKNYEFTLISTETVETATDNQTRSVIVDSCDNVDLYLYGIKNTSTGTEGFAITTTDRRIGNVIAFVPEGSFEEYAEDTSFALFLENLEEYIDETSDIWNDLSDEEISEFKDIANNSRVSASGILGSGDYTFSNWSYNSGNIKNILKTKWGQRNPYNTIVNKKKNDGKDYPVGCGPVALAQLFANLEYPKQCSLSEELCAGVHYDWKSMKSNPNGYWVSASAKNMIAALMYEIGKGVNADYKTNGTSCSDSNVESYLSKIGFSFSGFSGYNLSSVQNSIDNGYPVMVAGYASKKTKRKKIFGITYKKTTTYSDGHYWIIDGYARFSCTAKNKNSGQITAINENYVHCNLGWYGDCDGFYLSGLFDTRHVPLEYSGGSTSTPSSGSYNFQYKQRILTNLHR